MVSFMLRRYLLLVYSIFFVCKESLPAFLCSIHVQSAIFMDTALGNLGVKLFYFKNRHVF